MLQFCLEPNLHGTFPLCGNANFMPKRPGSFGSFLHSETLFYTDYDKTYITTSPKKRSKEYLSAVDLIQYTQIFLVSNLIWVWLILKCFHVIIKIKFSTLFNGKPDYLQQKENNMICWDQLGCAELPKYIESSPSVQSKCRRKNTIRYSTIPVTFTPQRVYIAHLL